MAPFTVAAVQAAYVLMDREATIDRVAALTAEAAGAGASWSCFPRRSCPATRSGRTPVRSGRATTPGTGCSSTRRSSCRARRPSASARIAREHGVTLVVGIDERDPHLATIYNTILYFGADGSLLGKHRKLMPTGSERTVWGMGDGSMLQVVDTEVGRVGGLICWENYMPLARFYLYSPGDRRLGRADPRAGDGWVATMRHIAREGRLYVIGVNPCVRVDQIPDGFPDRDKVWRLDDDGSGLGLAGQLGHRRPDGPVLAGPARHEETILYAEVDPGAVRVRAAVLRPHRPLQPPGRVPAHRRHEIATGGRPTITPSVDLD